MKAGATLPLTTGTGSIHAQSMLVSDGRSRREIRSGNLELGARSVTASDSADSKSNKTTVTRITHSKSNDASY